MVTWFSRRKTGLATSATAVVLLLAIFIPVQANEKATPFLWNYECVTCADPPVYGNHVFLDIDQQSYPHIIYDREGGLVAAYQDSLGWHSELIQADCYTRVRPLLKLDADGYEHILFQCDDQNIQYTYRNARGWQTQQILDVNDFVWQLMPAAWITINDLVLDLSGQPRSIIQATFNRETFLVYYVYLADGQWQIEEVGSGEDGALSLDKNGSVYAAHAYHIWNYPWGPVDSFLEFSYRDQQGWHTQEIAHPPQGTDVAIAIDSANQPRIVTNGGIEPGNYYWRNGNTWNVEPVPVDDGPILSLNHQDLATIGSYHPYGSTQYAIQQSDGWKIGGFESMMYATPGMALDGEGHPHFAYRQDGTHHVILAHPYTGIIHSSYLPLISK